MEILYDEIQNDIESTQDLIQDTYDIVSIHELVFIFLHASEEFDIITNIPILDSFYDIEEALYE